MSIARSIKWCGAACVEYVKSVTREDQFKMLPRLLTRDGHIGQLVDTSVSFRNTVLNESVDANRPVCRKVKAVLSILKL